MWRRRAGARVQADPETVARLVAQARAGNGLAREALLRRYGPFAARVASRLLGRFVGPSDDEASVGLIALNEAIDGYDPARSGSFLGFAEAVIRRRLIDHLRRQRRRAEEVPLSSLEQEGVEGSALAGIEARAAAHAHEVEQEAWERRQEIRRYARRLAEFGIRFGELPDVSPRHADARERALAVARLVASEPAYIGYLQRTRTLPLKELAQDPRVSLSRKTLERQRKFIVAVALILAEDFEALRQFIPGGGGRACEGSRA